MALQGRIGSFDLKTDNITEYIERVGQYFIANDVTDEKKQTVVFLFIIGNETCSLLRNLLAPESPAGKTVKTLSETLLDHLEPQSIIIAERYKFYCRDRSENEIITEYLAEFDFKDFLDQALRDCFVCGLQNNSIRRRLLAERKLTLKSAIELAKTMENADLETQVISTDIKTENVNAMNNATGKCYRCNLTKHLASVCRFKDVKCSNCHIKGHISKACRNRTRQTDPPLKMSAYLKTATPKPTSNIIKQMQTLPTSDVVENKDSDSDDDSLSF